MAWMMELASLSDVVLLFSKSFHFNATIFALVYIVYFLLKSQFLLDKNNNNNNNNKYIKIKNKNAIAS